jgi:hypothetical protein
MLAPKAAGVNAITVGREVSPVSADMFVLVAASRRGIRTRALVSRLLLPIGTSGPLLLRILVLFEH